MKCTIFPICILIVFTNGNDQSENEIRMLLSSKFKAGVRVTPKVRPDSNMIRYNSREAQKMSSERRVELDKQRQSRLEFERSQLLKRKEENEKLRKEREAYLAEQDRLDAEGVRRKKKKPEDMEWWEVKAIKQKEKETKKAEWKEKVLYMKELRKKDKEKELQRQQLEDEEVIAAEKLKRKEQEIFIDHMKHLKIKSENAKFLEDSLIASDQGHHLSWLNTLPLESRLAWSKLEIKLFAFVDGSRTDTGSISRLLRSLAAADYLDDEVSLSVHIDFGPGQETTYKFIKDNFDWLFGKLDVIQSPRRVGLLRTMLDAYQPTSIDEIAIVLEDDHEVNSLFYAWVKYAALTYMSDAELKNRTNIYPSSKTFLKKHGAKLYGFSLYTPTVSLTEFPTPFNPQDILNDLISNNQHGDEQRLPYLHQLPCGGGAFAFLSETWDEFRRYAQLRMSWDSSSTSLNDHSINVDIFSKNHVPSRTNGRSWKWLLLLEFAVSRNYFMLYPNFPAFQSFSTSHIEDRRSKSDKSKKSVFQVPLIQGKNFSQVVLRHLIPQKKLPHLRDLVQLDAFGDIVYSPQSDEKSPSSSNDESGSFSDEDWEAARFVKSKEVLKEYRNHSQAYAKWRYVYFKDEMQPVCKTAASETFSAVIATVRPLPKSRYALSYDNQTDFKSSDILKLNWEQRHNALHAKFHGEGNSDGGVSTLEDGMTHGIKAEDIKYERYGDNEVKLALSSLLSQSYMVDEIVISASEPDQNQFEGRSEEVFFGVSLSIRELSLSTHCFPRIVVSTVVESETSTDFIAAYQAAPKVLQTSVYQPLDLDANVAIVVLPSYQYFSIPTHSICSYVEAYDSVMKALYFSSASFSSAPVMDTYSSNKGFSIISIVDNNESLSLFQQRKADVKEIISKYQLGMIHPDNSDNVNKVKSFFASKISSFHDEEEEVEDILNREEHESIHRLCMGRRWNRRSALPSPRHVRAQLADKLGVVLTAERAGVFLPLSILSTCLGSI